MPIVAPAHEEESSDEDELPIEQSSVSRESQDGSTCERLATLADHELPPSPCSEPIPSFSLLLDNTYTAPTTIPAVSRQLPVSTWSGPDSFTTTLLRGTVHNTGRGNNNTFNKTQHESVQRLLQQRTQKHKTSNCLLSSSFRVGWGPGGRLLVPTYAACSFTNHQGDDKLKLECVHIRASGGTNRTTKQYRRSQYEPTLTAAAHLSKCVNTQNGKLTLDSQIIRPQLDLNDFDHKLKFTYGVKSYQDAARLELESHREEMDNGVSGKLLEGTMQGPLTASHIQELSLQQACDVWSLILALWGGIDMRSNQYQGANSEIMGTYEQAVRKQEIQTRRNVEVWLAQSIDDSKKLRQKILNSQGCTTTTTTSTTTTTALSTTSSSTSSSSTTDNNSEDTHLDELFDLLATGKRPDAIKKAISMKERRLGLILSVQSVNQDYSTCKSMRAQLTGYQLNGQCQLIHPKRLAIYRILGAEVEVIVQQEQQGTVDWRKLFGCFTWYGCSPALSVHSCLTQFRQYVNDKQIAEGFSSPYVQTVNSILGESNLNDRDRASLNQCAAIGSKYDDITYLLLLLHCSRSPSDFRHMSSMFNTHCASPSLLNYSLVFHLPLLLSTARLCTLELYKDYWEKVVVEFSAQLEREGLWQWSLFVLLHLPPSTQRTKLLSDVITQNVRLDGEWVETVEICPGFVFDTSQMNSCVRSPPTRAHSDCRPWMKSFVM